jgi:hypothetical protein
MLVLALAVAGCAGPRMRTSSGLPEVTIQGKTTEELKTFFMNDLAGRGYNVRNDDPAGMVFEKREVGAIALLFRSDLDPAVWNRVKLDLVDRGKGSHRVICSAFLVANRGSYLEREREVTGEWRNIQAWLERAKAGLETPAIQGPVTVP